MSYRALEPWRISLSQRDAERQRVAEGELADLPRGDLGVQESTVRVRQRPWRYSAWFLGLTDCGQRGGGGRMPRYANEMETGHRSDAVARCTDQPSNSVVVRPCVNVA
jgi:hypothetical protein